jgi:hypothetical protein
VRYDIKLGWKPSEIGPSGAPIPLNYNFDLLEIKEYDKYGLQIEPLYLGPRYPTSV